MNTKEIIKRWVPVKWLPANLMVKSLRDDLEGLNIVLYESEQDIHDITDVFVISFAQHYGYRNLDESFHLKTWGDFPVLLEDWSLFLTKSGDFIDSFNLLSFNIYKDDIVNYIIATPNDVIEVIAHKDCNIVITKEKLTPI